MQRIFSFPLWKTTWGKNLKGSSTLSELISELRKDFYLIFALELCLNIIFLWKNYATRPLAPENHENRNGIFSSRIFPKTFMDLPDGGELFQADLDPLHGGFQCTWFMLVKRIYDCVPDLWLWSGFISAYRLYVCEADLCSTPKYHVIVLVLQLETIPWVDSATRMATIGSIQRKTLASPLS